RRPERRIRCATQRRRKRIDIRHVLWRKRRRRSDRGRYRLDRKDFFRWRYNLDRHSARSRAAVVGWRTFLQELRQRCNVEGTKYPGRHSGDRSIEHVGDVLAVQWPEEEHRRRRDVG